MPRISLTGIVGVLILLGIGARSAAAQDFSGFTAINKKSPGHKSSKVIASDLVEGLLRPKWTRAMADLGSAVNLFRYQGDIYFAHGPADGHRGLGDGVKDERFIYVSKDDGKTWKTSPRPEGAKFGKYLRPLGGRLVDYWFEDGWTWGQTSVDGVTWTPKQKIYRAPYWLYEVTFEPRTNLYWCAAQSMASGKRSDGSWILRDIHLVKSRDGLNWEHVSTLPLAHINLSEAIIHFEPDGTMVVIIRRKWMGDWCAMAVARAPYTEWTMSHLPEVAEGHSFFEAGGHLFMGSRAYYRDEIPEIRANKSLRYSTADGVAYTVIHRFTRHRKLVAHAVVDSMGDCSYPRFVETPTEILVAFYSEHEDNVCKPYLAAFDKKAFLNVRETEQPDARGFPKLALPGKRPGDVITSDLAGSVVEPAWTRAMADGGKLRAFYRFKDELHLLYGDKDTGGATVHLASGNHGRSWKVAKPVDIPGNATLLAVNDRLFCYDFDGGRSWVRISRDGLSWSKPARAYKAPFWVRGVVYDRAAKAYWAVAHAVPGKMAAEREVHMLKSKDGIAWQYVSTPGSSGLPKVGAAALHFEADGTAIVLMNNETQTSHFRAVAPPPYQKWQLYGMNDSAEEHVFLSAGGRAFLATRTFLRPEEARTRKIAATSGAWPYVALFRLMKNPEMRAWGVVPSMGECGQPQLIETPTQILCAYTSQHEDGVVKPYLSAFDKAEFVRRR